MRIITSISALLISSLSFIEVSSQIRAQDLLHLSKAYYVSLQKFFVTVETKFRNAIMVDTNVRQETHYIDRPRNIKVFKGPNNAFVRVSSEEYQVNNNNTFQEIRRCYSGRGLSFK
jgi:hypothetical protein